MNQRPRLILVEGVPFTGKSTTSEYIAAQLGLNGAAARWVSEGMLLQRFFPHVMALFDQKESLAEATLRAEWSAFAETVQAADEIFVVDSALSYAAVDPRLMDDQPLEAIYAELRYVAEVCAPLRPRVFHLTGDAGRLVPASIAERGDGWEQHLVGQAESTPYQRARGRSGVAGAIELLRDSQELVGAVLARDAWPTLTLDVTEPDWAANRRAILAFLDLDEIAAEHPVIAPEVLRSYAGAYVTDNPDRIDKVLTVTLEDETLVIYAPAMRYGPLVPVSATRFHLQASPVDVEFVIEDGLVRRITLVGSDGAGHDYRRAEPTD